MHKKYRVTLTLAEREELERMLARGKADVRKIKHAQILLKAAALHGWLRHPLSGDDPQEGDDEDADNSFGRSRFGSRRAHVAPAQARCGVSPVAGGRPGDTLASTGRDGRDPERMAGRLRLRW